MGASRGFSRYPNVDEWKIRANCRKGVLIVHLPKAEVAGPNVAQRIDLS